MSNSCCCDALHVHLRNIYLDNEHRCALRYGPNLDPANKSRDVGLWFNELPHSAVPTQNHIELKMHTHFLLTKEH